MKSRLSSTGTVKISGSAMMQFGLPPYFSILAMQSPNVLDTCTNKIQLRLKTIGTYRKSAWKYAFRAKNGRSPSWIHCIRITLINFASSLNNSVFFAKLTRFMILRNRLFFLSEIFRHNGARVANVGTVNFIWGNK